MLINKKSPHGGDIYTNQITLDFSANVNPYGMPEAVKAALMRAADDSAAYPDPYCTTLRQKLSVSESVPAENILCGNGAAELIYQFAYSLPKSRPALIIAPAFCEYKSALDASGVASEYYFLTREDGFALTEKILQADFGRYCAVFICSPGNPTGISIPRELLYEMARRCSAAGTRLFCDFCFLDMSDIPDRYDVPALVCSYPNVFVLKAFTKSYAMAGVRLGYGLCTDEQFLAVLSEKAQCWNVSTLAQYAGIAALNCEKWLSDTKKQIASERSRIKNTLNAYGVETYGGEANYLLLRTPLPLYRKLLERGILVRDCSNYAGLNCEYIRIAVQKPRDNDILLGEIGEIIHEKS